MRLDLSVVIPCYNCENTIVRCLDSIPKGIGIEIILVDDCSSDNTLKKISGYQKTHPDEAIRIVSNLKNLGAGETRNKALDMVTRKYLMFVDSDDQLAAGFAEQVEHEFDVGFDCLIFDAEMVSPSGSSVLKMFYANGIVRGNIPQKEALVYVRAATWSKIYRSQIIRDHDIRFGCIPRNEDLVFTKAALCFCSMVRYLDRPLYYYNDNPASLMNDHSLLTEKNAMNAVSLVRPIITGSGFEPEFNSIYFLEIVYATTLTLLRMGRSSKECRDHFKTVHAQYRKKDPYRSRYMLKYRLSYLLYRLDLFVLFKLIFRYI